MTDSVARIGVGLEQDTHIADGPDETVETLIGIIEQRVSWNDDLPFAVPHGSSDQPGTGVLRAL